MMEEQIVRKAIRDLIERKEVRCAQLRDENKTELRASKRVNNEIIIVGLEHAEDTLIELEHNLRLCDCPPEAWDKAVQP
jgi:hypothetical protein